jgi:DNA polymerase-1
VPRILLIDGDVLAYKASAAIEVATEWEPGYWTWHCDENKVKTAISEMIDAYMAKYEAHEHRLILTDYENPNWRLAILPTYKGKRSNVRKPLVLKPVRQWMLEKRKAMIRPTLEGDDVMGILATWSGLKGEKIIVSIDKDMKTIPGLYVRELGDEPVLISEDEADYWHMYQTLMGDATDGYSGLPGVGPKKAEAILNSAMEKDELIWPAVLAAYEKKGLGEEEALRQARVARILRATDFNFKERKPILWTPSS